MPSFMLIELKLYALEGYSQTDKHTFLFQLFNYKDIDFDSVNTNSI